MTLAAAVRPHARRRSTLIATLAAVAAGVAITLTGCGSGSASQPAANETYGGLPSYLPSSAIRPDSVLTGTAAKPALTTEGDSVRVQLAAASVLATVSGPVLPGEGLPYQAPTTTCTWTVTLSGARGRVPFDVAAFTTVDHLGVTYRPALVPGQAPPPSTIGPGQKVTFELRAVMPTGEGLLRWAPQRKIVAAWDFEVETD